MPRSSRKESNSRTRWELCLRGWGIQLMLAQNLTADDTDQLIHADYILKTALNTGKLLNKCPFPSPVSEECATASCCARWCARPALLRRILSIHCLSVRAKGCDGK